MPGYDLPFSAVEIEEKLRMVQDGGTGHLETTVLFPTTQLNLEYVEGMDVYMWQSNLIPFVPHEGQRYKVTFNGAAYDCPALVVVEGNDKTTYFIGNVGMVGLSVADSGEPFLIGVAIDKQNEDHDAYEMWGIFTKDSTATMSISTEIVHPIDPKYVPWDSAPGGGTGGGSGVTLPVVIDFDELGMTDGILLKFSEGGGRVDFGLDNAYGVDYEAVSKAFPADGSYVVKMTVPDMGTMFVKPVYTLFNTQRLVVAHLDCYLMTNGVLTKFYVRISTASEVNSNVLSSVFAIVGFY